MVLVDSTSALPVPVVNVSLMAARWRRMERPSSNERVDAAALRPCQPAVEQRDAGVATEGEHLPKLFFQEVGAVQTAVGAGDVGQLGGLPLREVFGVAPQHVAGALEILGQRPLAGSAGVVPHLATDHVKRVGGPLHHVEGVHGELGVEAAGTHDVADPVGRICRYKPYLQRSGTAQLVEELPHGGLVPPRRSPHQPAGVMIDHHREVSVPLR